MREEEVEGNEYLWDFVNDDGFGGQFDYSCLT